MTKNNSYKWLSPDKVKELSASGITEDAIVLYDHLGYKTSTNPIAKASGTFFYSTSKLRDELGMDMKAFGDARRELEKNELLTYTRGDKDAKRAARWSVNGMDDDDGVQDQAKLVEDALDEIYPDWKGVNEWQRRFLESIIILSARNSFHSFDKVYYAFSALRMSRRWARDLFNRRFGKGMLEKCYDKYHQACGQCGAWNRWDEWLCIEAYSSMDDGASVEDFAYPELDLNESVTLTDSVGLLAELIRNKDKDELAVNSEYIRATENMTDILSRCGISQKGSILDTLDSISSSDFDKYTYRMFIYHVGKATTAIIRNDATVQS